jgi:nucleotide-binding universal stress UspA family protein
MKTIAILTDFSERSAHAARYALQIAKKIEANVLLYNAFLVPSDMPMAAAQVAWPVYEYDDIKGDAERCLATLCQTLKMEMDTNTATGEFMPAITCLCQEGPLVKRLPCLEKEHDLVLLVAGTHGADALATFLLGNTCHGLIDDTRVPLLLVPENAPIGQIEKIIFATDLDINDIKFINAVAVLAGKYQANVMIANVHQDVPADTKHIKAQNSLMQEIVLHSTYKRLSYRNIPNKNVNMGLLSILENEKPNMLVMVHRKTGPFSNVFGRSNTKKLASLTTVPLLVYPFPIDKVPTV